jgi:hypothetical protein
MITKSFRRRPAVHAQPESRGMVLPGRFELPFAASETAALSIELRERIW